MARRYYRSRVRYIKPKKRWASNIKTDFLALPQSTGLIFGLATELVANSSQTATPTPIIVKCGNFKCSVDIGFEASGSDIGVPAITAYIIFVPQGALPAVLSAATASQINGLITEHPEYIMAWRTLDSAAGGMDSMNVTFSSRMKRNLNSGDKVCLVVRTVAGSSITFSLRGSYTCQYWTCAN